MSGSALRAKIKNAKLKEEKMKIKPLGDSRFNQKIRGGRENSQ